jgi:hypothetical protein
MKKWQPFIVLEKELVAPPQNTATHVIVLRVKDCIDLEILEDTEVNCYKTAYELNKRLKISVSDFLEGLE